VATVALLPPPPEKSEETAEAAADTALDGAALRSVGRAAVQTFLRRAFRHLRDGSGLLTGPRERFLLRGSLIAGAAGRVMPIDHRHLRHLAGRQAKRVQEIAERKTFAPPGLLVGEEHALRGAHRPRHSADAHRVQRTVDLARASADISVRCRVV
jgi:hypothetical protein